jgi:hypothetical protein
MIGWFKNIWKKLKILWSKKKDIEDIIKPAPAPGEALPPGIDGAKKVSGIHNWDAFIERIRIANPHMGTGGTLNWDYIGESPIDRNWQGYHRATIGWYCPNARNPDTGEEQPIFVGMTEWLKDSNITYQVLKTMLKSDRGNKRMFGGDWKYYEGEKLKTYYFVVTADNQSGRGSPMERSNFLEVVYQ